jgi:hypothetical protein
MSLSGLGFRVTLALLNKLGNILSAYRFWKTVGIISYLNVSGIHQWTYLGFMLSVFEGY